MKTLMKVLAPYLAVLLFWVWLENGWLAILAYHAQVLLLHDKERDFKVFARITKSWPLILPAAATGIIAYLLLPHLTKLPISSWLSRFHLEGWGLLLIAPYFGIIHPFLEQAHWQPLWEKHRTCAPLFFAGYHMLVLYSLLPWHWLLAAFAILTAISHLWLKMRKEEGAIIAPTLIHICSDLGMIVAVLLLVNR